MYLKANDKAQLKYNKTQKNGTYNKNDFQKSVLFFEKAVAQKMLIVIHMYFQTDLVKLTKNVKLTKVIT